jgi:pimeloyl-ACP methyl ester carboxylesterase
MRRIWKSLALVTAAALMGACQTLYRAVAGPLPAPRMVDAGGHQLAVLAAGEGGPAVVLEAGLSGTAELWEKVFPEVSQFTRAVAYERAGLGRSERGPKPRTARRVAGELRAALRGSGVAPPYVLVGHSFGGFYVRVFAAEYPDEVAGLVLSDATEENYLDGFETLYPNEWRAWRGAREAELKEASQGELDEEEAWDAIVEEARAAWPLPDVPVVVITAMRVPEGETSESMQFWLKMHEAFVRRVPNARHVVTYDSGHAIPAERPDLVIEAIRGVVDEAHRRGVSPAAISRRPALW